jgi:hypothetical protein
MRFEVLTVVKVFMMFFWVVTSCGLACRYQCVTEAYCFHLSPEDGDRMFFQTIGVYLQVYTVLSPRRSTLTRLEFYLGICSKISSTQNYAKN